MPRSMLQVFDRLLKAFGPQKWWPGDSGFEMMVGAMLTQNTSWKNVLKAIRNLRDADLLDPHALYNVPLEELEELLRPAGYYRVKARRLRNLLEFIINRYGGSLKTMFQHRPRYAARRASGRKWRRTGNGRFDPALRRSVAHLCRRRLHASYFRPPRLDPL